MKKYLSTIGLSILALVIVWIWYQAFYAYLSNHIYYMYMTSSNQNWFLLFADLICCMIPIIYLLMTSEVKLRTLTLLTWIWSGLFWLLHSAIKLDGGSNLWIWFLIVIFNTILLFSLWIYLVCWFSAIWSWIERKILKFKQIRWQEILLSFGIWMISFIIIVQILLGIWILYWIISRLLFIWLWFMIRLERKNLKLRVEELENIINSFHKWLTSLEWNLNSKKFRDSNHFSYIIYFGLVTISLAYVYIGIQNAFTPYSTAWDANHEYMYTPKILAENGWVYRWNTVASGMPWLRHQFLAFIFSLTWCTNGRFWLSPDNIAISMNNLSAILVLIFGVAVIFQTFTLLSKRDNKKDENTNKWIVMWWTTLLLRLTCGMWAFLVIVDNKTDLWVMAISLLSLLSWLIFIQNRQNNTDKKDLLKYLIIAWIMFWFAALTKITAFVDFVLYWLLLAWLRFSPIISLWLWITAMWTVRKFNILTSWEMLTNTNANRLILIWIIITLTWLIVHLSKAENRKLIGKNIIHLLIIGISFTLPLIIFKFPWTTISYLKSWNFSTSNVIKQTFLWFKENNKKDLLAQNTWIHPSFYNSASDRENNDLNWQNIIDDTTLKNKYDDFSQCISVGNIYSEDELNEDLQSVIWNWFSEDFKRYIWFWRKEFTKENTISIDEDLSNMPFFKLAKAFWPKTSKQDNYTLTEKNAIYWIMKIIRPTSTKCYGFNHDAKILCENSSAIDNFEIDNLIAIYNNWIKNKDSDAGNLLKLAIDAYDTAKKENKLSFFTQNSELFHNEIVNLRQYYQSHSILSTDNAIYIPYRYLVPLNISFNRSLQNPSSYYTDIGFVWIIFYILILISLPYAIFKKNKILTSVSLVTIMWWLIWWIIWSAILWYGTVLISWTMITLALFIDQLFDKDKKWSTRIIYRIFSIIIAIFVIIQLIFNFMRINSQWANSVFVRYKLNVWQEQHIKDDLSVDINPKIKYWYGWKNVFDLQFPQYNPIINALAERKNDDWVVVAWTYIQYFLWNQRNIKSDWMLSNFWVKTSDWNLCKTYRRLKNDKTRYIIIDPNIWTVTMWEGNETLFYRFFGKLNNSQTQIEIDWTITTLIRLAQNGYLKLLSTNNIWAKYAFTLTDNEIKQFFGQNLTDEWIILTRAKMSVLQYFNDRNNLFWSIANVFLSRINDSSKCIEDIASIYWADIDNIKLSNIAKIIIWHGNATDQIKELNQSERNILVSYLNIYRAYQDNPNNVQPMVQSLLINSVSWWSQIIALELN